MKVQVGVTTVLTVGFRPNKAGLSTVGWELRNKDDSVYTQRTTLGVVELSNGYYQTEHVFIEPWSGYIRWDTGDVNPQYAVESLFTDSSGDFPVRYTAPLYKEGIKREVISALRKAVGNSFPDSDLRNNISVLTEFPMVEEKFPAIYVTYSENTIRNAGLGHVDLIQEDDGTTTKIAHWKFSGTLNFNILSTSLLERDEAASGLISVLGFGRELSTYNTFFNEIHDNDWIALQFLGENIIPGGDNVTAVPWTDELARLYGTTYRVNVFGEFFSDSTTGDLTKISQVSVYPYRPDQTEPQGVSDTAPWS